MCTRLRRARLAAALPPQLLVGGRGPRTLALAGKLADGVVLDAGLAGMGAAH